MNYTNLIGEVRYRLVNGLAILLADETLYVA
ncbi:Uncharacterised protein [Mycobacteroides abscessus subsp. abscessus]|nr:Uncharacterised protein [Mycobacteroides abscessus subsp. abscessus]